MRPESIKKFDLFFLAATAIGVAQALLNYETMETALKAELAAADMAGQAGVFLGVGLAIGYGISLLLWFLVSRMRQGWARWVLLALVAYRVVSIPSALAAGVGSLSITGVIGALLQVIAMWFMFRPDARAWFASRAT